MLLVDRLTWVVVETALLLPTGTTMVTVVVTAWAEVLLSWDVVWDVVVSHVTVVSLSNWLDVSVRDVVSGTDDAETIVVAVVDLESVFSVRCSEPGAVAVTIAVVVVVSVVVLAEVSVLWARISIVP